MVLVWAAVASVVAAVAAEAVEVVEVAEAAEAVEVAELFEQCKHDLCSGCRVKENMSRYLSIMVRHQRLPP